MRAPVVVAGGGLAGSLLSVYLARQGHEVTVYESRPDLRRVEVDAGRSINLALATRGIVPLVDIDVIDRVDAITIPMRGRMVHAVDEPLPELQPYGTRAHEVIHSVSRSDLNAVLLDAAEATGAVTFEFAAELETVDFDGSLLRFTDGREAAFGTLFGADGAGSVVRSALAEHGACGWETDWLDHDYKELTLPAGPGGGHRLDPNALHVWPRGQFMLIALANPGGDFTVTLFAPETTFAGLTTSAEVNRFFDEFFPDFAALAPGLADEFLTNPTGQLGTIRSSGWSLDDRAILVGDAAHAIVPFHGQGMNAALESVRTLDGHLRAHPDDTAGAFRAFEADRKPSTDAIAEMALDNYVEMRSSVVDPEYVAARALALRLEQLHPDRFSPRYNMVMFSTMPYEQARARAIRQAEIIEAALADPTLDVDELIKDLPLLPALDPLADPEALSVS